MPEGWAEQDRGYLRDGLCKNFARAAPTFRQFGCTRLSDPSNRARAVAATIARALCRKERSIAIAWQDIFGKDVTRPAVVTAYFGERHGQSMADWLRAKAGA